MDLKQRKLNKSEWDSIEISVSKPEIDVLNLIIKGFHNVTTRINNNNSIFTFLKIEYSEKIEDYIFNRYLRKQVEQIETQIKIINTQYKVLKIDENIKILNNYLYKLIFSIKFDCLKNSSNKQIKISSKCDKHFNS